jgi:hypothetical protein
MREDADAMSEAEPTPVASPYKCANQTAMSSERLAREWESRLLLIRWRAVDKAGRSLNTVVMCNYTAIVFAGFAILSTVLMIPETIYNPYSGYDPLDTLFSLINAAIFIGISIAVCIYCVKSLRGIRIRYRLSYISAWVDLQENWGSRLYVDEALHLFLQHRLDQLTLLKQGAGKRYRTFEQQLEFCAGHLNSLHRLVHDPEANPLISEYNISEHIQHLKDTVIAKRGLCIAIGCGGLLLLPLLALLIVPLAGVAVLGSIMWFGSQDIAMRSAMVALIDFVLERPDMTILLPNIITAEHS